MGGGLQQCVMVWQLQQLQQLQVVKWPSLGASSKQNLAETRHVGGFDWVPPEIRSPGAVPLDYGGVVCNIMLWCSCP